MKKTDFYEGFEKRAQDMGHLRMNRAGTSSLRRAFGGGGGSATPPPPPPPPPPPKKGGIFGAAFGVGG